MFVLSPVIHPIFKQNERNFFCSDDDLKFLEDKDQILFRYCDAKGKVTEAANNGNPNLSHFGEEANMLPELEQLFKTYGEIGTGRARHYVHDVEEAKIYGAPPGTFTAWEEIPYGTDLMIYEGLHGASITKKR